MSSDLKPTSIAFEKRYSDDSGVEFAVRLKRSRTRDGQLIEFERINAIDFPAEQLDWLIACLEQIRAVMAPHQEKAE